MQDLGPYSQGGSEVERVRSAVAQRRGAFSILVVHADGGGDWAAAVERHVRPIADAVAEVEEPDRLGVVGVVPVRETEAWLLADGDAVRSALGLQVSD